MAVSSWRYGFSSVIGTSHKKSGIPCQDACSCNVFETSEGESVLIAVVSDGAGSASRAEVGSKLVCSSIMDFFGEIVRNSYSNKLTEATLFAAIDEWIVWVKDAIQSCAMSEGLTVRDYACTVLCAIIGSNWAAFFQIGDGAMVVANSELVTNEQGGSYNWVFWPQKGEYENTTYFVTSDEAFKVLQRDYAKGIIQQLAIFTDGLQGLALQYNTQTVHNSFFSPMFDYLENHRDALDITDSIRQFLNWEKVNSRTDDDKTLILASRRSQENV